MFMPFVKANLANPTYYAPVLSFAYCAGASVSTSFSTTGSASLAIGTAASNRYVFVVIVSSYPPTGVTVGGISATLVASSTYCVIFRAAVPTGTSATVAFSGASLLSTYVLSTYAASNLNSISPIATTNGSSATAVSLSSGNGGFVIGGLYASGSNTFTSTATKNYTTADFFSFSSASVSVSATTTSTSITSYYSSSSPADYLYASFR